MPETAARRAPEPRIGRTTGAGGARLSLLDWGGDGPPLLLLHGYGHGARIWEPFAAGLRARYRVLAYDQRGHNDSDPEPHGRYIHKTFAADLAAVVDDLALSELAIVGHSMGGYAALRFAGSQPERVRRLVLIETPAEIPLSRASAEVEPSTPPRHPSYASPADYAARLARRHPRAGLAHLEQLARHWLRQRADGRFEPRLDPEFLKPREQESATSRRRVSREEWTREESDHMWACLGKVPCPTLVVRGERSSFRAETQQRMVREALARGRGAVIPGAGHVVAFDAPDELARELQRFLLEEG